MFQTCKLITELISLRGYFFSSTECRNYSILNESTRNKNYRKDLSMCDKSGIGKKRQGSWKGTRWYRFKAPDFLRVHLNFQGPAKKFVALPGLDG